MTSMSDFSEMSIAGQAFISMNGRKLIYENIYVYYDMPLLFTASDQFGVHYFVDAAEIKDDTIRWIVCEISELRLWKVAARIIPLYDVFKKAESGNLFVVTEEKDSTISIKLAPAATVVDDDLPIQGEYLDSDVVASEALAHFHINEKSSEYAHAADALSVSDFIKAIVKAINAYGKDLLGIKKKRSYIQVAGFALGSLDIVLQVPAQPLLGKQKETLTEIGVPDTEETVESLSLRKIAEVISLASNPDARDAGLGNELSKLPEDSRQALGTAAKVVDQSRWDIHGEVNYHTGDTQALSLTGEGATRLLVALDSIPDLPQEETLVGFIDGYRRSDGTLFFKESKETKRPSQIQVEDVELIQKAAEYATEYDELYTLEVEKTEKADGFGDVKKIKRILRSIVKTATARQGTIDNEL